MIDQFQCPLAVRSHRRSASMRVFHIPDEQDLLRGNTSPLTAWSEGVRKATERNHRQHVRHSILITIILGDYCYAFQGLHLDTNRLHMRVAVPVTLRLGLFHQTADNFELCIVQVDAAGPKVLREPVGGLGSRDGNCSLCNYPSQSQLTRGTSLLLRELLELVHDSHVGGKVLLVEPRDGLSKVAVLEIGCALDGSSQDSLAER